MPPTIVFLCSEFYFYIHLVFASEHIEQGKPFNVAPRRYAPTPGVRCREAPASLIFHIEFSARSLHDAHRYVLAH